MKIRFTQSTDIPALQVVLNETGLFPGEMLPDMLGGFLSDETSSDLWLTCELNGQAVGFCYAVPEQLADGTWNMLAIAVQPGNQGAGLGGSLVRRLETLLTDRGCRVVIVDTSGRNEFAPTREFYKRCGYVQEARIRDFWAEGDDKIVFWKRLS